MLIIGVVSFGAIVSYHSGKIFGSGSRSNQGSSISGILQDEMMDMERAMAAILQNHKGTHVAALHFLQIPIFLS
jgi:hypothetical protein